MGITVYYILAHYGNDNLEENMLYCNADNVLK